MDALKSKVMQRPVRSIRVIVRTDPDDDVRLSSPHDSATSTDDSPASPAALLSRFMPWLGKDPSSQTSHASPNKVGARQQGHGAARCSDGDSGNDDAYHLPTIRGNSRTATNFGDGCTNARASSPSLMSKKLGDSPTRVAGQRINLYISGTCPRPLLAKRTGQPWTVESFEPRDTLAESPNSLVISAKCVYSGLLVVLKAYHKRHLSKARRLQVQKEISNHAAASKGDHVVDLWAAFEDATGVYLVMAYAAEGDLFYECERWGGRLPELKAVQVLHPLLQVLSELHKQGIIHRDVKPENILIESGSIMLTDFGLSINAGDETPFNRVGTFEYMAPELLTTKGAALSSANNHKIDVWSVGVVAYELLSGINPFESNSRKGTMLKILGDKPELPPTYASDARGFVSVALTPKPEDRPSIDDLLKHPWIQRNAGQRLPTKIANARDSLALCSPVMMKQATQRPNNTESKSAHLARQSVARDAHTHLRREKMAGYSHSATTKSMMRHLRCIEPSMLHLLGPPGDSTVPVVKVHARAAPPDYTLPTLPDA